MHTIEIIYGDTTIHTTCQTNETVLDLLRKEQLFLTADCGGTGTCGKCKVILNGVQTLACQATLTTHAVIEVPCHTNKTAQSTVATPKSHADKLAIDIGSTTIVLQAVADHPVPPAHSMLNGQIKYGADVISRIAYQNAHKNDNLTASVQNDLQLGIEAILADRSNLREVVISCNTVMAYLLLGLDTTSLGLYPFAFVTDKAIRTNLSWLCDNVLILPSISAFVGGDILSGILYTKMYEKPNTLLLDIGTNTEMVINNNGQLIATSTSAGPAFEGGNISCGTGAVPGAIFSAAYRSGKFILQTIDGHKPVGICGSGLIDIMRCLLDYKLMDRTGLLIDEFFESGVPITDTIRITQDDIRQFQLAKASIRAATEFLLSGCGDGYTLDTVFLCGSFGSHLNLQNASRVGLFPPYLLNKIKVCGNTSLEGATATLTQSLSESLINTLRDTVKSTVISEETLFSELFIQHIDFE